MHNGGTLSVTTDDIVQLHWPGGHNVHKANGHCSNYSSLGSFNPREPVAAEHPGGGSSHDLEIPAVSSLAYFCYACTSHYDTMKFTLEVSPSSSSITCIDDTVKVKKPDGTYIVLTDVRLGDRLATPTGETVVQQIQRQDVYDRAWSIPAGVCNATVSTILSPAHAIRCNGLWKSVEEVGVKAESKRKVAYMNLLTDNYCSDVLILQTGLVVETWDGRARDEWRPHRYEDGERLNCD